MTVSTARRQHAIIYIPGLGDQSTRGQGWALGLWRRSDVRPVMCVMRWYDLEPFDDKLARLLAEIDRQTATGKTVSLVAASASASIALHAFAARPLLNGLVCFCGKLQGYNSVHPATYRKHRAFQESMQRLPASYRRLEPAARQRILSLHPLADESVPTDDTKLSGVVSRTMPVAGHFWGIAYGLTMGSLGAIRFLRRLAEQP